MADQAPELPPPEPLPPVELEPEVPLPPVVAAPLPVPVPVPVIVETKPGKCCYTLINYISHAPYSHI